MNERECHPCSPNCFELKSAHWRICCVDCESWDQNMRDTRDFRSRPEPRRTNKGSTARRDCFSKETQSQVPVPGSEPTSRTRRPQVLGPLPRALSCKQSEARLLSRGWVLACRHSPWPLSLAQTREPVITALILLFPKAAAFWKRCR